MGLPRAQALSTGAEMRLTNPGAEDLVLCVNGGSGTDMAGTWSASLEWLVVRLARQFPALSFAEVRFRIKSWRRLELCAEDAAAALAAFRPRRALLVGFSMGGAVATTIAAHSAVQTVLGLAPWIPDRISVEPLRGRRLAVVHGALDRYLPGIPGVSPTLSRRSFERARALGVEGEYTLLPGAVHGIAVRAHWGRPLPLPRASRWLSLAGAEVERFQAADG